MRKYALAVLGHHESEAPADQGQPSPVTAFCAALLAMACVDGDMDPAEREYLDRTMPHPEVWAAGSACLEATGTEALLGNLTKCLGPGQRQCLMANALGVAMVDGLLRSPEQEFLERLREVLEISEEDYTALYEVFLAKSDMRVFA